MVDFAKISGNMVPSLPGNSSMQVKTVCVIKSTPARKQSEVGKESEHVNDLTGLITRFAVLLLECWHFFINAFKTGQSSDEHWVTVAGDFSVGYARQAGPEGPVLFRALRLRAIFLFFPRNCTLHS